MPSEDYSRWPPCAAGFFVKGERPRTHSSKKKIMKTKNTNSNSELKNRTAQHIEKQPELLKVDFNKRNRNRALPLERLLELLQKETPHFWEIAEVIGKWVWIQFDGKQPVTVTSVLSELGFHWNNKRQSWQHPCGLFRDRSVSFDPRKKYGSYFVADRIPA